MRALVLSVVLAAPCAVSAQAPASAPAKPAPLLAITRVGENGSVRLIAPDVWLYVSEREDGVAGNSLVVSLPDGPLLVDPPWGDTQTEAILDWSQRALGRPIAYAVSTHSHADRTGGIGALDTRGIKTGALALTAARTKADKVPAPEAVFTEGAHADARGFELFFPGAGHAPDNIVVWLPKARVLFGGCLVKAEESADLGNVADADLAHWPAAIEAVRARYPTASIVVPGHGRVGTTRALDRTVELVAAAPKPSPKP
jgi:metallo-beta-lactamase class B